MAYATVLCQLGYVFTPHLELTNYPKMRKERKKDYLTYYCYVEDGLRDLMHVTQFKVRIAYVT